MRQTPFSKKAAAIFILSAFAVNVAQPPVIANPLKPAEAISIPPELGRIEESFQSSSGKTIIYIQDAHDSLEAQENIARIIGYLVEYYGVETVFEEGYEGQVPTDKYFSFIQDPEIKEKVAYFLMDKLRLGGAEYAHVNRKKDFKLVGADSIKLHLENIKQYQESAKHKAETEKDLDAIGSKIKRLGDRHFPKELKEWLKLRERFDEGRLDLLTYLKRMVVLTPQLPIPAHVTFLLQAEAGKNQKALQAVKEIDPKVLFYEINLLENALADYYLKNETDRKIFQHYKNLGLLKRLNDIRLSPDEYELVKTTLQELKTENVARSIVEITGKSIVLSKRWEQNIQNAIRFYDIAETRDQLVGKSLDTFLASSDEKLAVMVFGGFHKNRLQQILKRKRISCLTVSPEITAISDVHQYYYQQLMSVGRLPFEASSNVRSAAPPGRALEVIPDPRFYLLTMPDSVFPKELKEAVRSEMRTEEDPTREIDLISELLKAKYASAAAFFGTLQQWRSQNPNKKLLTLVRHGQSASNLYQYTQSLTAYSPLTRRGMKQRDRLVAFMEQYGISFDRFISSDLERAYRSIEPLAQKDHKKVDILRRMREVPVYPVGGIPKSAVITEYQVLYDRFVQHPDQYQVDDFSVRKLRKYLDQLFFEEIPLRDENNIIIASHGMTILSAIMIALKIPSQKYQTVLAHLGWSENVALTVLAYDPDKKEWELLVNQDNSYLPEKLRAPLHEASMIENLFFYLNAIRRLLFRNLGYADPLEELLADYVPLLFPLIRPTQKQIDVIRRQHRDLIFNWAAPVAGEKIGVEDVLNRYDGMRFSVVGEILWEKQAPGLAAQYSYYKFGSPIETDQYATYLLERIRNELGKEIQSDPAQWILMSPPGSLGVPPNATYRVGEQIAEALGIRQVIPELKVSKDLTGGINYSGLNEET